MLPYSHKAKKGKRLEKRSAPSRLAKKVFLQHKVTSRQDNRTISQDICTLFPRICTLPCAVG